MQLKDFIAKYESVTKDGEQLDEEVSLAGRIMNKRASGNSLIFYDLCAEGLKVQVTAEARAAESLDDFKATHERTTTALFSSSLVSLSPRQEAILSG